MRSNDYLSKLVMHNFFSDDCFVLKSYRDIHIECFQTIQMKLILLCVWAELAVLGSTKTALKFKYEI